MKRYFQEGKEGWFILGVFNKEKKVMGMRTVSHLDDKEVLYSFMHNENLKIHLDETTGHFWGELVDEKKLSSKFRPTSEMEVIPYLNRMIGELVGERFERLSSVNHDYTTQKFLMVMNPIYSNVFMRLMEIGVDDAELDVFMSIDEGNWRIEPDYGFNGKVDGFFFYNIHSDEHLYHSATDFGGYVEGSYHDKVLNFSVKALSGETHSLLPIELGSCDVNATVVFSLISYATLVKVINKEQPMFTAAQTFNQLRNNYIDKVKHFA